MLEIYKRQLILPTIGLKGQKLLGNSKAIIVGCGGLGCPVATYLAAAGVGHLDLFDSDVVAESNLNRQFAFKFNDVSKESKAKLLADFLVERNPYTKVSYQNNRILPSNFRSFFTEEIDIIIDCTDGLVMKFFLNDAAVYSGIPLVHGAVTESTGQLLFVQKDTACLRCIMPDLPDKNDVPSCTTVGVLGASCGVVGSLMASEVINYLLTKKSNLANNLLQIDLTNLTMNNLQLLKNDRCPSCSAHREVMPQDESEYVT